MTNLEYIRTMNDDMLADFLEELEIGDIDWAQGFCDLCDKDHYLCTSCFRQWLANDCEEYQGLAIWEADRKAYIRTEEYEEALRSCDEGQIRAYCKKYDVSVPDDPNEFWAAVHKLRLSTTHILRLPEEEKEKSRQWLKEHGYASLIPEGR